MRSTVALTLLVLPLAVFAVILFLVPPDLPWFLPYRDGVLDGLMIFWMILSIPFGIVTAIDWFRSPQTTTRDSFLRHLFRVPLFLLGVTAIFIGISVLAWVAYNVLWDRRPEFQPSGSVEIFVVMIGFGGSLIGLAFRRDGRKVSGDSRASKPIADERDVF